MYFLMILINVPVKISSHQKMITHGIITMFTRENEILGDLVNEIKDQHMLSVERIIQ